MSDENKKTNMSSLCLSVAGGFLNRVFGLFKFGRSCDCLLISPCHSVHTFGISGYTDLAFFDQWGVVVKVERLAPRRVCSCRGAEGVLERPVLDPFDSGTDWFCVGDRLSVGLVPGSSD